MSLWSALSLGNSGLNTSQNALNTTAHNMVNADTTGYTRQQVQQADKSYITMSKTASAVSFQQTGLGVSYSNVKQVRDYFLDKTYRQESGRSNFYQVSAEALAGVEDQLGELNGEAFQESLTDLWTAVQELSKDPCSSVTQGILVQQANEFLTRAQAVYDGLSSYQDNLNSQIKQQVEKINKYGDQLLELNDQIRKIEAGGEEHANDLRDQRNHILDELSSLASMSYDEDVWGNVSVQIEGVDFVKGSSCYHIALDTDEITGFYTPYWPQNAEYTFDSTGNKVYDITSAKVFNLNREISSDAGTDVGGLKAMVLARGDHRADYTDISEGNYDKISQSVCMNIQAEFDQMIHAVMTEVNKVLADAAGVVCGDLSSVTYEDGTTEASLLNARYIAVDACDYLASEKGYPLQLFEKSATAPYVKVTATDAAGVTKDYWLYVEEDPASSDSLYTTSNTMINQELMQSPAHLGFRLPDGSEDNATIEALKNVFTTADYNLNPNVIKKNNLVDYYSDLVSQVANSAYVFNSIYENQLTTVEAAQSARDQVTAVSTDEELSNMIKFQNAYNASSRFINVVNEMIEHLLNSL